MVACHRWTRAASDAVSMGLERCLEVWWANFWGKARTSALGGCRVILSLYSSDLVKKGAGCAMSVPGPKMYLAPLDRLFMRVLAGGARCARYFPQLFLYYYLPSYLFLFLRNLSKYLAHLAPLVKNCSEGRMSASFWGGARYGLPTWHRPGTPGTPGTPGQIKKRKLRHRINHAAI